jgi:hypothetical protein
MYNLLSHLAVLRALKSEGEILIEAGEISRNSPNITLLILFIYLFELQMGFPPVATVLQ